MVALGTASRNAKRNDAARAALTEAAERFEALGAGAWAAAARAGLGQLG
jgi:hypothetical protein